MSPIERYDNACVTNAINPSIHGHHHGPILNPNPGWEPARQVAARAANQKLPAILVTDVSGKNGPPVSSAPLSTINSGVCDIVVDSTNIMCGSVFQAGNQQQVSLRRHCRQQHPGALTNPTTGNVTIPAKVAGTNALKLWVRSGGWRDAHYFHEPGVGPVGGWIDTFATEMETLAANDATFAYLYGTRFHREVSRNPRKRHSTVGQVEDKCHPSRPKDWDFL